MKSHSANVLAAISRIFAWVQRPDAPTSPDYRLVRRWEEMHEHRTPSQPVPYFIHAD